METRTRQLDASPAATRRRHRRLGLQAAGAAMGVPNGLDAGATHAALPSAVREPAAPVPGPRPARPPRVAALGPRLARPPRVAATGAGRPRLAPPVIAPIASCGPSHASSGGS